MTEKKIAKGVVVCCEKADRFKKQMISVNIGMPLNGNLAAKAILPFLLHRTNSKYDTVEKLNRRLAMLYGASLVPSVQKVGEVQLLSLTLTAIDDRFSLDGEPISKGCMELLCDCLFRPSLKDGCFLSQDVEREKRILCELIESEKDEKRIYALERCEEEMCRDELYGQNRLGTAEQVEALTPKDVFAAWTDVLLHGQIQINLVGSADIELAEAAFKPLFDAIGRTDTVSLSTEFITTAYESRYVEEQQQVKQSKLVMGFRAGMTYDLDNYAAIRVMTAIFGGGTFSKLFMNVREKQSLCYYCSARLNRAKGLILVQSGVETENAEKALLAIRHELEQTRAGSFTDETVQFAKLSIRDTMMSVYDSPESLNSWYATQLASGTVLTPEAIADMTDKVSREEIILAANEVTEDTVYLLKAVPEAEQ